MLYPSVYQILKAQAARAPEALAILAPGCRPLTYGGLYQHVRDAGIQLREIGIRRRDCVAVVLPDASQMAVAFLAVAAAATSAPLNPHYRIAEYGFYLSALQARALLVAAGVDSPAREAAYALGMQVIEIAPVMDGPAGQFTLMNVSQPSTSSGWPAQPDDVAMVLPTSGTTAQPKLVPLTHRNLCVSARQYWQSFTIDTGRPLSQRYAVVPHSWFGGGHLGDARGRGKPGLPSNFQGTRFFYLDSRVQTDLVYCSAHHTPGNPGSGFGARGSDRTGSSALDTLLLSAFTSNSDAGTRTDLWCTRH